MITPRIRAVVSQQRFVETDLAEQRVVLVLDLLAFQCGQPAQLHVEDGLRLFVAEAEAGDQLALGVVGAVGGADDADDLVQELERDAQALQNVRPLARHAQQVLRAAGDHLDAMIHVDLQRALEAEQARLAVDQRQQIDAERALERRVLEELVQHLAGRGAALELDDDVHPLAVRLVAQIADVGDAALAHQLGDALQEGGLVELVGDFGHQDPVPPTRHLLDAGASAHDHAALAGAVGQLEFFQPQHQAAGGEVRAVDELHQLVHRDILQLGPAIDHVGDRVGQFAQVVRRDVRRHADRDAAVAVQQQVGQQRGQNRRLLEAAVEIIGPVDGIFFDVGQQRLGDARQPGLGVTHGRGRIPVHRAEVALPIHQRIAQAEVLRQARHRVVHGRVAMRMILAQHLTDDTGGFLVGRAGAHPHIVHGIENPALHGLETVARIGQRARNDHAHGIVKIRPAHLFIDADRTDNSKRTQGIFDLVIHGRSSDAHHAHTYYTSERRFQPFGRGAFRW